jgi:hypothetical protein
MEQCWLDEKAISYCLEEKEPNAMNYLPREWLELRSKLAYFSLGRKVFDEKAIPKQPFPKKKYRATFLLKEISL